MRAEPILDDLIKLYAESVCRDLDEMSEETFKRRVELHDKLCDVLGVEHDDFSPFLMTGGLTMDIHFAERIIRKNIEWGKKEGTIPHGPTLDTEKNQGHGPST